MGGTRRGADRSSDGPPKLIVPPQCSLCLHVVSSLVGQTFTQGARWYEEQITIE